MNLFRLKQPINSPLGSFEKGTVKSAEAWKRYAFTYRHEGNTTTCQLDPEAQPLYFEPVEPVYILQRDLPDVDKGAKFMQKDGSYVPVRESILPHYDRLFDMTGSIFHPEIVENNEKWFKLEGVGETVDDLLAKKEMIQKQVDAIRANLLKTKPSLDKIIEWGYRELMATPKDLRTYDIVEKTAKAFNKSQMESVIEEMEKHRAVKLKGAFSDLVNAHNSALTHCISIIKKHLHN